MLYVIGLILVAAFAYAMQPPDLGRKPPGLGEIDVPTAEIGREIPVLFGERDLKGPNVVWFGDLETIAVKK